jgi:hypothetical protein
MVPTSDRRLVRRLMTFATIIIGIIIFVFIIGAVLD